MSDAVVPLGVYFGLDGTVEGAGSYVYGLGFGVGIQGLECGVDGKRV